MLLYCYQDLRHNHETKEAPISRVTNNKASNPLVEELLVHSYECLISTNTKRPLYFQYENQEEKGFADNAECAI
jgi:hypothetical protein